MKKTKKLFKKTITFFSFWSCVMLATTPLLISCSSQTNQLVLKELSFQQNSEKKLNQMQSINVDIKKLLWGDPFFNNGNYIIIYGTTFPTEEGNKFLEWLSKDNITTHTSQGKKIVSKDAVLNPLINNQFFKELFKKQISDSISDQISAKAKIILFLDIPDEEQLNKSNTKYKGYDFYASADPFAKYHEDQLVKKYNVEVLGFEPNDLNKGEVPANGNYITSFNSLPDHWKLKLNDYIRNDQKTIKYREIVEYALRLRSNISSVATSDNKNSGIIAFSKTKDSSQSNIEVFNAPISPSLGIGSDIQAAIENLKTYYFPK